MNTKQITMVLFGLGAVASQAAVLINEGFETNTLGALSGQSLGSQPGMTWAVSASTNWSVVNTMANSGTQSLKATSTGSSYYAWPTPVGSLYAASAGTTFVASYDLYIDATSDSLATFGMTIWTGTSAARKSGIRSTKTGTDVLNGANTWVNSVNTSANASGWVNFSAKIAFSDATNSVVTYYRNGVQMGATSGYAMSGPLNEIDLYSFNGTTRNAYFDNFKIESVPEPATVLVLSLGAIAASRRRRV